MEELVGDTERSLAPRFLDEWEAANSEANLGKEVRISIASIGQCAVHGRLQ